MKNTDPSSNDYPVTDWQLLGELKLSDAANAEAAIHAWLVETLAPLHFPVDFLTRIKKSVLEAALNLIESDLQEHNHVHLLIFTRKHENTSLHAWGFFRIEKLDGATQEKLNHTIEFYLYPDG